MKVVSMLLVCFSIALPLIGFGYPEAHASPSLQTHYLRFMIRRDPIFVHVGILNPDGPIRGDILYVHGFGDCFANHVPLFQAWINKGFRVIAFDLPSHGSNYGPGNDLNDFDFKDLAKLAAAVEMSAKPKNLSRPLFLSGWSTGGLLVVRILQAGWTKYFSRPIAGAVLFAPGIAVRKLPWTFGNRWGEVTRATLTHNPQAPNACPIKPDSPFWNRFAFGFAPDLVFNSMLSQWQSYPTNVPTLIFSGGNTEDMYAKSWVIRAWTRMQNKKRLDIHKPKIIGIECPHSRHEMDNESARFGGTTVRTAAARFVERVAKGQAAPKNLLDSVVCEQLR